MSSSNALWWLMGLGMGIVIGSMSPSPKKHTYEDHLIEAQKKKEMCK